MWFRLRLSPLGSEPAFSLEAFWECPEYLIRRALHELDQWEQLQLNLGSLATARLASMGEAIAAGFAGSKPKSTPLDFLPFPDRFKTQGADSSRKHRMATRTREVFNSLLRRGSIPTDVAVAFSDEIEG